MKRYFELVNLAEQNKPKALFFEQRTGNDLMGYIESIMKLFGDSDMRHYRLYEHETKATWKAKQDEMATEFNGTLCYFVNRTNKEIKTV